jgi:hypothetical protein
MFAVRDGHLAAEALLIRLAAPDGHQRALGGPFDVGHVERHELRAAERASEAKQEDGPVAELTQGIL